jgi:hypothetical protein
MAVLTSGILKQIDLLVQNLKVLIFFFTISCDEHMP